MAQIIALFQTKEHPRGDIGEAPPSGGGHQGAAATRRGATIRNRGPRAPVGSVRVRGRPAQHPCRILPKDALMARSPDDPSVHPDAARRAEREAETVIPVVEERARIEARDRVVGRVRVATQTREENVELAETLRSSRVEVERVPVDAFVDEVPEVREENGVTIVPVMEEVLVRRLLLREEVHIRRVEEEREVRETVTLRTQEPVIEREGGTD